MDLITKAGPAQVIPESRWLKNWGSNPGRISSRSARRAITVARTKEMTAYIRCFLKYAGYKVAAALAINGGFSSSPVTQNAFLASTSLSTQARRATGITKEKSFVRIIKFTSAKRELIPAL